MNILEIIAVIFSFTSVILTVRKNLWCWPTAIIASVVYIFVLVNQKLYGAGIMQFVFIFQAIYGWFNWKKNIKYNDTLTIEVLDTLEMFQYFIVFTVLWLTVSSSFIFLTDDKYPLADSFVCVVALMANFFLSKRLLENWVAWILSDIVFIWIFISNSMYVSTCLYVIFLCIATYGFITWNRDYKLQIKN